MHRLEHSLEKKNIKQNSIIVIANREKFKNLIVYDAINKILNKNKILAPKLYYENYRKNFMEIEDFGDKSVFKILCNKKNKFFYFKKVIHTLIRLQKIKDKSIKNFKKKNYTVPLYDKEMIIKEANIFCDWYVKKNFPKQNRKKFIKEYKKIVKKLASLIKLKNNVFVHRDFHVSNLMLVSGQIGLIDTQDALIGNKAYDLASLIDDVRLKTSMSLKRKIYNYYINKNDKLEKNKFKNDFEILSILRNLKIIGIFTRLAIRDKKKNYLRLIPHSWNLISIRINENKIFKDLKDLLNENLKKKLV